MDFFTKAAYWLFLEIKQIVSILIVLVLKFIQYDYHQAAFRLSKIFVMKCTLYSCLVTLKMNFAGGQNKVCAVMSYIKFFSGGQGGFQQTIWLLLFLAAQLQRFVYFLIIFKIFWAFFNREGFERRE